MQAYSRSIENTALCGVVEACSRSPKNPPVAEYNSSRIQQLRSIELEIFESKNEHVANTPRAQAAQASEVLLEFQSGPQKDANIAVTRGCRWSLGIAGSSAEPCMVRRLTAQFIMTTGRLRIRSLPSHYAI